MTTIRYVHPTTPHTLATGCGLVQSDFDPNDPPCIDGGTVDEHPAD